MKKKQILCLISIIILVMAAVIFWIVRDKEDSYSTDYEKNEKEDVVVYDGKKYRYNEHLSNYLFMGIDTREPVEEEKELENAARADAIFLLSYDRVKKTLTGLSIPRDTIANVRMIAADGTDMGLSKEHINMQYAFGDGKDGSCQLMKETVSNLLYGVPIQGYCSLNMDGIAVTVDVLDGVTVVIPDDSLEKVNPEFVKGSTVLLTKENVEQFIRYRDTDESHSALARTNRQKVYMKAMVERTREKCKEDNNFLVEMYESLQPYMITNIGNDVLAKVMEADYNAEMGLTDIPGKGVEGTIYDEYHVDETQLYELVLQLFYKEE